jgi:hypothetical protein
MVPFEIPGANNLSKVERIKFDSRSNFVSTWFNNNLYYIKWLEVMDAWQYVVTLHSSSTVVKKIE